MVCPKSARTLVLARAKHYRVAHSHGVALCATCSHTCARAGVSHRLFATVGRGGRARRSAARAEVAKNRGAPRRIRSPPTGCGVAAHSVARAPQASAGRKHTGRGARRGVSVADSAVGRGTSNQHTGVPKGRGSPVPHSGRSDAKRVAKQPYGAQPPMLLPTVATGVVPAGPHLQVSQQGTRGRAWAFYSKKKQQSLWPLYKLRFER